jgi:hypothetical protein
MSGAAVFLLPSFTETVTAWFAGFARNPLWAAFPRASRRFFSGTSYLWIMKSMTRRLSFRFAEIFSPLFPTGEPSAVS